MFRFLFILWFLIVSIVTCGTSYAEDLYYTTDITSNFNWGSTRAIASSNTLTQGFPAGYTTTTNLPHLYSSKWTPGWPAWATQGAYTVDLTNEYGEVIQAKLGIKRVYFTTDIESHGGYPWEGTNCTYDTASGLPTTAVEYKHKPNNVLNSASCAYPYRNVKSRGGKLWTYMAQISSVQYALTFVQPSSTLIRGTYSGSQTMKWCHDINDTSCAIAMNTDQTASYNGNQEDTVHITLIAPHNYALLPLASSNIRLVDVHNKWLFTGQPPKTLYNEIPIQYIANVRTDWIIQCQFTFIEYSSNTLHCGLADSKNIAVGGFDVMIHLPPSHEVEGSGSSQFELQPMGLTTVIPKSGQDRGIGKIAITTANGFTEEAYKNYAGQTLSGRITIRITPRP